jgi:gluconate 5-dehydrogenase
LDVKELFNLRGQVAVVTGGAGHLGSAISEALAECGANLVIAGRDETKGRAKAESLAQSHPGKMGFVKLDIRSMPSTQKAVARIMEQYGQIDVWVNNSAFYAGLKIEEMSEEEWVDGIDGTVHGVFRCIKAVLPAMSQAGKGSIINIASMYGTVSPDPGLYEGTEFGNPPNYGAGKAAIVQLTRYAACHLAPKGIRVNAISPGPFPRPQVQEHTEFIRRLSSKNPMGRIGQSEELKGSVAFLASEASSYVTGVNIPVDGGWTAW